MNHNMKKLIIIGGFGNGSVVASTVNDINKQKPEWEILGFLNDRDEGPINGLPVLGSITPETVAPYLNQADVFFYWALVSVKLRKDFTKRLFDLGIPEERFATLVHPTAIVSDHAKLGYGVSVQPFVNIGPGVRIANYVHVFAQAMIGHDAKLDNFAYVANNACVGAHVHLEEGAYVGTNATTRENLTLGEWSLTGIGSVVVKDVAPGQIVIGNPARPYEAKTS
jgi:acetyltransferase EpsM